MKNFEDSVAKKANIFPFRYESSINDVVGYVKRLKCIFMGNFAVSNYFS